FSYRSALTYSFNTFSATVSVDGAARQSKFNPDFGEQPLPAYSIAGASVSKQLQFQEQAILLKAGVENLFNTNYTTFADWNRLPRMGRNVYLNVIYNF